MRIVIFILAATGLFGQTFEVASVKVNRSGDGNSSYPRLIKGRLTATNSRMRFILQTAWGLTPLQISGPAWIESESFDLAATSPPGVPDSALGPMLQALLRDPFHLQAHKETRELPVYNFAVGNEGPKVKPFDPAHVPPNPPRMPGAYGMVVGPMTMTQLAANLERQAGRRVIDKTGLDGRYFCVLQFGQLGAATDPDQAPDIFGAVQQQLGLRLEPAKGPVEVLVIDRLDRTPTAE